jgi:plastocyanin
VFSHELVAARAEEAAEHESDDEDVVELARDGNEVRNEIEGQREVADERGEEQLPATRDTLVGKQPRDEDEAVGHEPGEGASLLAAPGDQQSRHESDPGEADQPKGKPKPLPPGHSLSFASRGSLAPENRPVRRCVSRHMSPHRLPFVGAVVVVVAALAGGCGGSSNKSAANSASTTTTTSSSSSGGSVIKTVAVHETEYKLTPNTISLSKPGTYVFKGVNDGTTAHALAVEGNGIDQDGAEISAGSSGTLKVTLPKTGTYEIYCPVDGHKGLGMKGTITVGGSSASGGGTSTENMNTGTTETGGTTTYSSGY